MPIIVQQPRWGSIARASQKLNAIALSQFRVSLTAALFLTSLKLGARPGTIRQWFHRAIPYRWQKRLMEYFEGPVEISDWAPEATAAIAKPSIAETWRKKHPVSISNLVDWTFLDAAYRRGLAPEPQTISLGLGRSAK
jgi:hypothetical protein